jgi:hypothetical protein
MTGPDITPAIAAFRVTLQDTCRVVRSGDVGETPELGADGKPVAAAAATVYEGPCTVADPTTGQRSGRTVNDEAGVPVERLLKLPVDSPDVRSGDRVTVLTSRFSPSLIGDVFVVIEERERSYSTHRRYVLRGSS